MITGRNKNMKIMVNKDWKKILEEQKYVSEERRN